VTNAPTDFPTFNFSSPSYSAAPTPPLAPTETPTAGGARRFGAENTMHVMLYWFAAFAALVASRNVFVF
jgi:hypothetical protein